MKIKALLSMAGDGWSAGSGEVVDLPEKVAQPLIAAGVATAVDEAPKGRKAKAERAVKGEGEKR